MSEGKVEAIYLRPGRAEPMSGVESAEAITGKGLEGDSQMAKADSDPDPGHQVTLVEAEAVEAAARGYEVKITPDETRRNIVTRGVALNHLVGREFSVGGAKFKGERLCEPCAHLEQITREGVRASLIHRGGLRASIVSGGAIRVGDSVSPVI